MGIVNVTPDSFSDGGRYFDTGKALHHGLELLESGAAILDVGGESTRPGAREVSEAEELDRVIPVIEGLAGRGALVSVDTSKPVVMREAARAGALIINDVCALQNEGALEAAVETGCGVVLMHMKGTPRTMQQGRPHYEDPVREISSFLLQRAQAFMAAGGSGDSVLVDPGFGFGKSVGQNLEILNRCCEFTTLGFPLLYGMSRKSSLGAITNVNFPQKRVISSVAAHLYAVEHGADVVRVHDVREMREALDVWTAIYGYRERLEAEERQEAQGRAGASEISGTLKD